MNKLNFLCLVASFYLVWNPLAYSEVVIEDQGVTMTKEELSFLVNLWTQDMQAAAANDQGDRLELINMALSNKKMAERAESITPESDKEAYWRHVMAVRNLNSKFVMQQYLDNLTIPDLSELAKERYLTDKKRYAYVAERRQVSHILFMCLPGKCDRVSLRPEAEAVLEELLSGADFEGLVKKYSDDRVSKNKGGKFEKWFRLGEPDVDAHFTGGAFEIEDIGSYSGIVETQFGFHIIRLDDRQEAFFKPYNEVKDEIIASLRKEYVDLAAKDFNRQFMLTNEAVIDSTAMDEVFSRYKAL